MAAWGLSELLQRLTLLTLQGANWQRSGGKGQKPKPIPLPDAKGRGDMPARTKAPADGVVARLRNLGMIPPGATD